MKLQRLYLTASPVELVRVEIHTRDDSDGIAAHYHGPARSGSICFCGQPLRPRPGYAHADYCPTCGWVVPRHRRGPLPLSREQEEDALINDLLAQSLDPLD